MSMTLTGYLYAGETLDDLHGYLVASLLNENSDGHQCNSVECYFKFVVLVPSRMTARERRVGQKPIGSIQDRTSSTIAR